MPVLRVDVVSLVTGWLKRAASAVWVELHRCNILGKVCKRQTDHVQQGWSNS